MPARAAEGSAPARGEPRPRAPGWGAAGRGGAPLVQWCGAVRRPGRLGRGGGEDGAPEALADSVSSGRAAVVSWCAPCDGAGRKEAP